MHKQARTRHSNYRNISFFTSSNLLLLISSRPFTTSPALQGIQNLLVLFVLMQYASLHLTQLSPLPSNYSQLFLPPISILSTCFQPILSEHHYLTALNYLLPLFSTPNRFKKQWSAKSSFINYSSYHFPRVLLTFSVSL